MNSPRYNVQSNPVNMDTEAGAGGVVWRIESVRCINRVPVLSGPFL